MNINKTVIGVAALTSAIALGVAGPSNAASFPLDDVYVGSDSSNYWYWDTAGDLSLDGVWNDMWAGSGDEDTWDDTGSSLTGSDGTETTFTCNDPADLSDATDGSGDKILTCDAQTIDNGDGAVDVTSEFRFYADGKTVRERYIITNNGTEPVVDQVVWVNFNAYQDSSTYVNWANGAAVGTWDPSSWASDDYTTNETDYTWITDDRDAEQSSAVVKYAVGRADSTVGLANDGARGFFSGGHGGSDDSNSYYELPSIAAGQTVEIVVLAKVFLYDDEAAPADGALSQWETNTYNTVLDAQADTALESNAVVYAGIDDTSRVLNWTPVAEETLAETGFDSAPIGTIALFALAGGVALVIRRRLAVK